MPNTPSTPPSIVIVEQSLADSAELSSEIRSVLKKQVGVIRKRLSDPQTQPGAQAELVELLLDILARLDTAMNNSARILARGGGLPQVDPDSISAGDVMAELVHGTARNDGR